MAASNKSTSVAPKDEADELFDNLTDGDKAGATANEEDFDDLLDEVEEDDSEGWVPTEKGEGISGLVTKIGETRSDFANEGENPMVPTVVVETKDGTKYRVIGYGAVLKRELQDADPHVGDLIAVKYFGEKLIRKGRFAGKPYKHFGVVVRRARQVA
jgi:hypothetical protein